MENKKEVEGFILFEEHPLDLLGGAQALLCAITADLRTSGGVHVHLEQGLDIIDCAIGYAMQQIKKGYK